MIWLAFEIGCLPAAWLFKQHHFFSCVVFWPRQEVGVDMYQKPHAKIERINMFHRHIEKSNCLTNIISNANTFQSFYVFHMLSNLRFEILNMCCLVRMSCRTVQHLEVIVQCYGSLGFYFILGSWRFWEMNNSMWRSPLKVVLRQSAATMTFCCFCKLQFWMELCS